MAESYKTPQDELGFTCTWCDKPLVWVDHFGSHVCSKCHNLLSSAGIKRAEIFGKMPPLIWPKMARS